jgi:hypothetical protein
MNASIQVFGYHGTSRANAIRILNNHRSRQSS